MPGSQFFAAALIIFLVLGFAATEAWKVKDPNADRIRKQCEMQNITEVQVNECKIRLTHADRAR
jgi:hypothetical protein